MPDFTGLLGAPIEGLKTLIANCSSFQSFAGVENATAALARVFMIIEDESSVTRPMVLITYMDGDYSLSRDAAGSGVNNFVRNSALTIVFQKDVSDYSKTTVATFLNQLSAILADMVTLSGDSNYMIIDDITYREVYQAPDGETQKRLYGVFSIGWGI